jgi:sporulation protein YlmC with PRC-barrel domain
MAAVDLQTAERIGEVDEFVVDPVRHRVVAVLVAVSRSLLAGTTHVIVPAAAIHSIGPDALTAAHVEPHDKGEVPASDQEALPRASQIVGRNVASQGGTRLGTVADILLGDMVGEADARPGVPVRCRE